MKGSEVVTLLRKNGWMLDRVTGSHHIMTKDNVMIPVPVHKGRDLAKGTLHSILKQAGLK